MTDEEKEIINWAIQNGTIRGLYPNRALMQNTNVLNQITQIYMKYNNSQDINCGCSQSSKVLKRLTKLKTLL